MYPQRRGVYVYARVCVCVFLCTRLPLWASAHSDNTIIMRGWKFILDLGGNARAERQQLKVGPRPFQWISLLGSNYVRRIWKYSDFQSSSAENLNIYSVMTFDAEFIVDFSASANVLSVDAS